MNRWGWVTQYIVAFFFALLLGALLGSLQLFQGAELGSSGLTASAVVQFLGYGAALLMLWLAAGRAAEQIPEDRPGLSFLRHTITPFATLIVLAAGYRVLLLLLRPFLTPVAADVYRWLFVAGIIGAAVWLGLEAFKSADALGHAVAGAASRGQSVPAERSEACQQCGAPLAAGAKFCGACGRKIGSGLCANCGGPLSPGTKFCVECGTPVG